jgi:hypothetical protein
MVGDTTQKNRADFDWQLCQSDTEWAAVSQAQAPIAPRPRSPIRRFLPLGLGLLLLLTAGGLRWHSVQTERAAVEAALAHTANAEIGTDAPIEDPLTALPATRSSATNLPHELPAQGLQRLAQSSLGLQAQDRPMLDPHSPDGGAVTRLLRVAGDVAVVEVTLPASHDQPALRQTRVYQRTGSDWVRIAPSATYWGSPLQWEGEHLIFRYYAYDTQAVAAVAAPLDARYAELHRLFLGEPPTQKLAAVVDPAQPPGQIATRTGVTNPLVVASPGVYLAPASISDAELLAQSLLLALLNDLKAQALQRNAGASFQQQAEHARVDQLLEGVQLWQLWQGELPLASWREPVVQWVFSDARPSVPAPGEVAPAFRAELCAMHRLWMATPFELDLPLTCHDSIDQAEGYFSWRRSTAPPLRLAQVPLMTAEQLIWAYSSAYSPSPHPAAEVALATVLAYAADTYGPERIPLLLAEAGCQEGWATLIPAVFGVNADEFETGWQAYLAHQYGITP